MRRPASSLIVGPSGNCSLWLARRRRVRPLICFSLVHAGWVVTQLWIFRSSAATLRRHRGGDRRCVKRRGGASQTTRGVLTGAGHAAADARGSPPSPCWKSKLFRLDAGRLDDRPPLLDLSLMERGERLRRLLLRRHDLLAKVGEPLADSRFGERINGGGVEPPDDIPGCAFRSKQRVPDGAIEARQSGLIHRRNVRGCRQAGLPGHGKSLDIAGTNLWQGCRLVGEYQVNLFGHQVLHRGRTAAVGHEPEPSASGLLEEGAMDVLRTADAGGSRCGRIRVGLQPGDEAVEIIHRQRLPAYDEVYIA